MYGIQTIHALVVSMSKFENDVNMYGIQTEPKKSTTLESLRMM